MEVACDVEEHGVLQVEVAMITELQQSFLAFCSWMGLLKQTGYGWESVRMKGGSEGGQMLIF